MGVTMAKKLYSVITIETVVVLQEADAIRSRLCDVGCSNGGRIIEAKIRDATQEEIDYVELRIMNPREISHVNNAPENTQL
jgi:hypothetical protein